MCIDVCPVGALTSGSYRYKTRPWEMNHVSTVCTHCGDGCKVTLGVRQSNDGSEIVRADNRDKSGINGDFLCAKGRFGFDFVESPDALDHARWCATAQGKLEPATWEHALRFAAASSRRFATAAAARPSASSAPTTPPTKRITCCRSSRAPFSRPTTSTTSAPRITRPLRARWPDTKAKPPACATSPSAPAILLVGGNPTDEHPLLAWNLRTNVRLNKARLYVANDEADQAGAASQSHAAPPGGRLLRTGRSTWAAAMPPSTTQHSARPCSAKSRCSSSSARSIAARRLRILSHWGLERGNVRFAYLGDYANSRGAADMGLLPDLLPGYVPVDCARRIRAGISAACQHAPGKTQPEMFAAAANGDLGALLVVGANPVARRQR